MVVAIDSFFLTYVYALEVCISIQNSISYHYHKEVL